MSTRASKKRSRVVGNTDAIIAYNVEKFVESPIKKRPSIANKNSKLAWEEATTNKTIGDEVTSLVKSSFARTLRIDPLCFLLLVKEGYVSDLYHQDATAQKYYKCMVNEIFCDVGSAGQLNTNTAAALFMGVFPIYVVLKKGLEIYIPFLDAFRSSQIFDSELFTCDIEKFHTLNPDFDACEKFSLLDFGNDFIPSIIAYICVLVLSLQSHGEPMITLETECPSDPQQFGLLRKNILSGMVLLVNAALTKFKQLQARSFNHAASVLGFDDAIFRQKNLDQITELKKDVTLLRDSMTSSAPPTTPFSPSLSCAPALPLPSNLPPLPTLPALPSSLSCSPVLPLPSNLPCLPDVESSFFQPVEDYRLITPPQSGSPARLLYPLFENMTDNPSFM